MLTPFYKNNVIPRGLMPIVNAMESDMLSKVAKSLLKFKGVTGSTEYRILKAQELGILFPDLVRTVGQYSGMSTTEISRIFEEAGFKSFSYDKVIYDRAKIAGLETKTAVFSESMRQILNAGASQAISIYNLTNTKAIQSSIKTFTDSVDKAYMSVASGITSFDEAYKLSLKELAANGITLTSYNRDGVIQNFSLEGAVRRDIITSVGKTCAKVQEESFKQMDTNLVEVSSHAGARPSHALWQGRVFWWGVEDEDYDEFESSTGYGQSDGLCGINCYHDYYPHYKGLSTRSFDTDPARHQLGIKNDALYELGQQQRGFERIIRDKKKALDVFKVGGDKTMIADAQRDLFTAQSNMRQFITDSGGYLERDYSREAVGKTYVAPGEKPFTPTPITQINPVSPVEPPPVAKIVDPMTFTTVKEADDYCRDVLGMVGEFKGCGQFAINEWLSGLTKAKQEFPLVAKNIKYTGTSQNRNIGFLKEISVTLEKKIRDTVTRGHLAELFDKDVNTLVKERLEMELRSVRSKIAIQKGNTASSVGGDIWGNYVGITLNKVDFQIQSITQDSLDYQVFMNHHPVGCNTIKSVLDHEFGHQLANYVGVYDNREFKEMFSQISLGATNRGLSGYATVKKEEFVAEAWSEYKNNVTPRTYAKQIGELMERLYARY